MDLIRPACRYQNPRDPLVHFTLNQGLGCMGLAFSLGLSLLFPCLGGCVRHETMRDVVFPTVGSGRPSAKLAVVR